MRVILPLLLVVVASGCKRGGPAAEAPSSPDQRRVALVQAIQRADYQGDRPALSRLHQELSALPEDSATAARQRYWEGFALWRRAINGANEKREEAFNWAGSNKEKFIGAAMTAAMQTIQKHHEAEAKKAAKAAE